MSWPEVGRPLPGLHAAYAPPEKWTLWILAEAEHGPHWRRVFGAVDADRIWAAIRGEAATTPVSSIRKRGPFGRTAEVRMEVTLNDRTAMITTGWHYDYEDAAPRLVTAYPTT